MSGNYGARQPNNTAYIKRFFYGETGELWKTILYTPSGGNPTKVLTPTSQTFESLYITGNLYVDGNIINPSDAFLKDNISDINEEQTNKLMNIKASRFTFNDDPYHKIHYGFIAQDFEKEFPELISVKPDSRYNNLKAINYLEIIPLLVDKIQMMQKEIDELKRVSNSQKIITTP
jgi:hypothetical protein